MCLDVTRGIKGVPPIAAARCCQFEAARPLIEAGSPINQPVSLEQGSSALHAAVTFGRLNMVAYLLQKGANPT